MTRSRSKPRRHNCGTELAGPSACASRRAGSYPLDSFPLFLGHADGLSPRRHGRVLVDIFTQQLKELVGVLSDELRKLRVTGANLLQNRLEHLRLVLDDLAQLLELRVVSKKVQVAQPTSSTFCTRCGRSCRPCPGTCAQTGPTTGSCPRRTSASSTPTRLGGSFEKIDRLIATIAGRSCGRL